MKHKNILISILSLALLAACEKPNENEFPEVISGTAEIESFTIEGAYITNNDSIVFETQVDSVENKIFAVIPPLYDINNIIPGIKTSRGAVISPASGEAQDFSTPVTYDLVARNGIGKSSYEAALIVNGIKSFTVAGEDLAIDYNKSKITRVFDPVTSPIRDFTKVIPVIEISEGSTISPAGGVETDFSAPVEYTVTSVEGYETKYLVTLRMSGNRDYFVNFADNWTAVNMTFETTAEGTLIKRDGGFAHAAGAYSNSFNAKGDYAVEVKLRFLQHNHFWATAGFFINGDFNTVLPNADQPDPGLVFCLIGDANNNNMVAIHKPRPIGWVEEHTVIEGLNSNDWTTLRIEKTGNLVQFFVNGVKHGTPVTFENVEGNIGLMGEFSEAEFEYIEYQQL